MNKPYRASNKKIIARGESGKFRRTTFADLGLDSEKIQEDFAICAGCGHGSAEEARWYPFLREGVCPVCGDRKKDDERKRLQIDSYIEAELDGLGEAGRELLLTLLSISSEQYPHPRQLEEADAIKARLSHEFKVKYLKQLVLGWR